MVYKIDSSCLNNEIFYLVFFSFSDYLYICALNVHYQCLEMKCVVFFLHKKHFNALLHFSTDCAEFLKFIYLFLLHIFDLKRVAGVYIIMSLIFYPH